MEIKSQMALNLSSTWLHTWVRGELIPLAEASLPILTTPSPSSHPEDAVVATTMDRDAGGDERREECGVVEG